MDPRLCTAAYPPNARDMPPESPPNSLYVTFAHAMRPVLRGRALGGGGLYSPKRFNAVREMDGGGEACGNLESAE